MGARKSGLVVMVVWTLSSLQVTFSYSYSSANPSYSARSQRGVDNAGAQYTDFNQGFPHSFAQGLPTFDFAGPMTSDSQSEQSSADKENLGFVHGPPDGFPSLSQLGGDFPSYGNKGKADQRPYKSRGSTQHHQPVVHHGHAEPNLPSEYHHGAGPNPVQNQAVFDRRPPSRPLRLTKVRSQPNHPRPDPGTSSSGRHREYLMAAGHEQNYSPHSPRHQPRQPVVLKVSNIKTRTMKLPPPPPPFYAPSPDLQATSLKNSATTAHERLPTYHGRYRREVISKTNTKNGTTSDQIPDGSGDTYWEVSSPFIAFDNYEDEKTIENHFHNNSTSDHDAGEQRFFPSFPSTNSYLGGIHPYIPAPAARPALFPGPSANRAPSRAHHAFGLKYPQVHPQRGPSGAYTAESHDHGDRYVDSNLLGSGNFEVVRGGTFYEDDESYHPGFIGTHHSHPTGEDGGDYYHHNGHSSPSGFGQPGSDFFANFRDFADINPHSRAYSHNYETAQKLESTASERRPENILDKLESRVGIGDTSNDHGNKSINKDPMMATY